MQKDFKDFKSDSRNDSRNDFRKKAFDKARRGVAEAFSKKDVSLIQATRALDDLDSIKSLMSQRLAEWVGANFPEYKLQNDENTARVFAEFGSKEKFKEEALAEIVGAPKAKELIEAAKASYGVEFTETEREAVKTLAALTAAVYEERKSLQEFIENQARTNARNISTLIEPLLAARLISLAGGLEKLAKMPASTIQVIGAEKALFKHLRMGTQPPKHGLIFQSPLINAAPLHQRGKIARALATKLSIAAKADWFTGNFIAEKLKAILDARLKQIREGPQASEEKKRELRANEQRRQADRQREWQNSRPQRNPSRDSSRGGGARGGFRSSGERRSFPQRGERGFSSSGERGSFPQRGESTERNERNEQRGVPREAPQAPRREFAPTSGTRENSENREPRENREASRKFAPVGASERRDFRPAYGGRSENREFRKRDGERRDYAAGGSHERREFGHGERTPSGQRGGFEHERRGPREQRGGFNRFRKPNKFRK